MLKKMWLVWKGILFAAILLIGWSGPAMAGTPVNVQLSPDLIQTDASFPGAQVKLTGQVPPGSEVYVKLIAKGGSVTLSQKGKEGIFWLNERTVHISGLPAFYVVFTSSDIQSLPAATQKEMGLYGNFGELLRSAKVTANTTLSSRQSAAFVEAAIKMNQAKGVYQERVADFDPAADGSFSYRFLVPKDLPAGQIQVQTWAVKNNAVIASSQSTLAVQRVGLGGYIAEMAQNEAVSYGLMAILAALLTGVAINFLFGGVEALTKAVFRSKAPAVAGKEGRKKAVRTHARA